MNSAKRVLAVRHCPVVDRRPATHGPGPERLATVRAAAQPGKVYYE